MSNHVDPDRQDEHQLIDVSGVIETPEQIEARRKAEDYRKEQDHQNLLIQLERRQTSAQEVQAKASRSISRLTVALVIMSFVAGFVAFLQFQAADRNARAAEYAAKVAQDTLSTMNTSGARTKEQVDRLIAEERRLADGMNDSARMAKEGMDASNQQSAAVLDASIEASRIDQRAWLTVQEFRIEGDIYGHDPPKILAVIKNTGKTPAIETRVIGKRWLRSRMAIPQSFDLANVEGAIIGPSGQYNWRVTFAAPFLPGFVTNLELGNIEMTIEGVVQYRDVFADTPIHKTGFCGMYAKETLPLMKTCQTGKEFIN